MRVFVLQIHLTCSRQQLISCRKRATFKGSKTRFVFTSASQKFLSLYRVAYRGLTSVATLFPFGRVSFLTARSAYRSIREGKCLFAKPRPRFGIASSSRSPAQSFHFLSFSLLPLSLFSSLFRFFINPLRRDTNVQSRS